MTSTTYLADIAREELAQVDYLLEEARRDLQEQRNSETVYAYYHNGQTEGVY